ncbi:YegP family protein [Arthrobacter sp. 2RAF22]|uniref:YegP family protein n=1 Tax=Arthrobacter sp. 2RAF22 TaxID=3232996 RepID=UPI003F8E22EF
MAGTFELFRDGDKAFRFRLTSPDGTVVALSEPFPDKASAVAGIAAVRECAGMGLIADLCPHIPLHRPSAQTMPAARTTSPLSTAAQPSSRSGGALPPRTATVTPAGPGHGTSHRPSRRTAA